MPTPDLADVVQSLDLAVFRREGTDALQLVGRPPLWLAQLWPSVARSGVMESVLEVSPYLDNFMVDADAHWKSGKSGRARSGPWVEQNPDGNPINLEATALTVGNDSILLIQDLGESYQERREMLQTAREKMLAHERLNSEIQRKEVLLHCIIHDMCSPLQNMMMALSMLDSEILAPDVRGMVQLGLQAGKRQEVLIDNVLHTYTSELRSLFGHEGGTWPGVDICSTVKEAVELHKPLFAQQNVTLVFDPGPVCAGRLRVPGDEEHLSRVVGNLLGNALRHSPSGGTVTVRGEMDDEWITLQVEDEGQGVPPQLQAQLFQKFQQGAVGRGKVGLGLYFCRITVSKWGGETGYTPRPGGGSIFWLKLPRLPQS